MLADGVGGAAGRLTFRMMMLVHLYISPYSELAR